MKNMGNPSKQRINRVFATPQRVLSTQGHCVAIEPRGSGSGGEGEC